MHNQKFKVEKMAGKAGAQDASARIDAHIGELNDWRGEMLAHVRELIGKAVPDVVETWKWRGVPVWERAGILCTGESHKNKVKLTFAKAAKLDNPAGLFNASLDGKLRRAIDLHQDDQLNAAAFIRLIRAAAALNTLSNE